MNLADILDKHAIERPKHPAIEEGERIVTYIELRARVGIAAANLRQAGILPGDLVAVMLPDSVNHIVTLYALASLGAVSFAIDELLPPHERKNSADGLAIKALIGRPDATPLAGIEILNVREMCRQYTGTSPLSAESGTEFDGEHTLMIVKSSGTTGTPKQIPIKHNHIAARSILNAKYTGLNALDRYLSIVRLTFFSGSRRVMTMLHLGATMVINQASSYEQLLTDLVDKNISYTHLLPFHLHPLMEGATGDVPMIPNVRITVASARLTPEQRLLARRRLTPHFFETYGTNETGLLAVARPEDQDTYPDSVGRLIEENKAEVVDDENRPLASGQTGQIRFQGRHIAASYLNNPDANALAFRQGWFYPGDLAAINEAGYVFLKGRSDDVINNEGTKFYPIELENVLVSHPDVIEAAVLGWPHRTQGEVAVAFVVRRSESLDEQELMAYCREQIAAYKMPSIIAYLPKLPKNPMGKVLKEPLRAKLNEDLRSRMPDQGERGGES